MVPRVQDRRARLSEAQRVLEVWWVGGFPGSLPKTADVHDLEQQRPQHWSDGIDG